MRVNSALMLDVCSTFVGENVTLSPPVSFLVKLDTFTAQAELTRNLLKLSLAFVGNR